MIHEIPDGKNIEAELADAMMDVNLAKDVDTMLQISARDDKGQTHGNETAKPAEAWEVYRWVIFCSIHAT